MVIRFTGSGSEAKGMMDIPAQSAKDIPLSKVDLSASKVYFEAFSGQSLAAYDGQVLADGSIAGRFTQGGFTGAFTLKRAAAKAAPTAVPVPYKQEEVTVRNGAASLAGTLTLPTAGRAIPGGRADQRQRCAEPRRGGFWLPAIPPDRRSLYPQRDRRAAHG